MEKRQENVFQKENKKSTPREFKKYLYLPGA